MQAKRGRQEPERLRVAKPVKLEPWVGWRHLLLNPAKPVVLWTSLQGKQGRGGRQPLFRWGKRGVFLLGRTQIDTV